MSLMVASSSLPIAFTSASEIEVVANARWLVIDTFRWVFGPICKPLRRLISPGLAGLSAPPLLDSAPDAAFAICGNMRANFSVWLAMLLNAAPTSSPTPN